MFLACPAWLTTASRWHCGLTCGLNSALWGTGAGIPCGGEGGRRGEKLRGEGLRCSFLHQLEELRGVSGGGGESGELWPASLGWWPKAYSLEAKILCCGLGVLGLFHTGARTGLTNSSGAQSKLYSKSGCTRFPSRLVQLSCPQIQDTLRSNLNTREVVFQGIWCPVKPRQK